MMPKLTLVSRRWPILVIAVVVLLFIALSVMSSFYIDLLWYREIELSSVFWKVLRTRILLGSVLGLLFFFLLYLHLLIVQRLTPAKRIAIPGQEEVEQIRRVVEPHLRWLIPLGSGLLSLLVGIGASTRWSTYMLWRNGAGLSFGSPEPLFDRDPSFYVFKLPWLHFLQSWLFSSLVGVTVLVTIAHLAWGGIQLAAPAFVDKISPAVRAHLSVLFGLIMVAKAWGYYLERFDLVTSPRGVVDGASYTDVRAQMPALNVLTLVAVICAALFLVNIWKRRWNLPIISVGLLLAVSVMLGAAYPAFVQQFSVKPQEQERETPYIKANIDGTRRAFNLDTIDVSQRPADATVTSAALDENRATLSNIRLWRPTVLRENFQSLQRIRQYYEFADVDVDRYEIAGDPSVLMISGREVSQNGIPTGGKTWQNTHLVYTHGFGAVAAQVNTASEEGAPTLTLGDIPPVGSPAVDEPRIYFGELNDVQFVVTNTGARELDYEGAAQEIDTVYSGTGGIPMGNLLKRTLFAWRYQDINLLISGLIDSDSRIMILRQLQERVPKPAPFLTFDSDPYLAIVDGRLLWIYDGYTTTTEYPYSQSIDLGVATDGLIAGEANYMRNSVKVTVDAYTGQMIYYLAESDDPIAAAWAKAFPDMFTPLSEASTDLRRHFRYPENLFQVQAAHFATYHVTDPGVFFQKQDVWQIPIDPTIQANGGANAVGNATGPMHPYYVLMRLPSASEEHFQLILPFTPEGRQNMTSWMAADSDPDSYGQLTAYTFPSGRNVDGPTQVFAQINQDPTFSTFRTLLGQEGSTIIFGDLLVIPINDSLLYVEPVYVRSNQESSIPELKRVVVVNGNAVGVGTSLSDALAASTSGASPSGDGGGSGAGGSAGGGDQPTGGTLDERAARLLDDALQRFVAADAALRAGDLSAYQTELKAAQGLVQQANDLIAPPTGSSAGGG